MSIKKQNGFSLIELMVVVAVIGVLTAIAVPTYQNYIKKAELGAALATLNALKVNVEDYIATNSKFPLNSEDGTFKALEAIQADENLFTYGILKTENTGTKSDKEGRLTITLGEEGSSLTNENSISITRNEKGSWDCIVDLEDKAKTVITPKGCSIVASPEPIAN